MELQRLSDKVLYTSHEVERDRPLLGYIKGANYSVMVDAGASRAHAESFFEALAEANLSTPEYTVLTHWHWDHTFGMCAVKGRTIAQANTEQKLREMNASENIFSYGDKRMQLEYTDERDIDIVFPDMLFDNHLVLNAGDVSCHLIHVPSPHSDDATAVLVSEENILFLGDATSPDYFNGGTYDSAKLAELMQWLEACDFDLCLLGHAEPLTRNELMGYLKRLLKKEANE